MDIDQLKRKLRELKKVEERVRFGADAAPAAKTYVWNSYFSTRSMEDPLVKYPLQKLVRLEKQELKEIFEEYFYSVYFQKYKENGMNFESIYDLNTLSVLGLHPGASMDDIKRKFRELAKKYHPDHGGESEKMIELLEAYHRLLNKE